MIEHKWIERTFEDEIHAKIGNINLDDQFMNFKYETLATQTFLSESKDNAAKRRTLILSNENSHTKKPQTQ